MQNTMRVSHPQSGMNIYLNEEARRLINHKPTDKFDVSASLEGETIWVRIHRNKKGRHAMTHSSGDWYRIQGPSHKTPEGRFLTELDVPEFGVAYPVGWEVDGDHILAELPPSQMLKEPQNMIKALGFTHGRSRSQPLPEIDPSSMDDVNQKAQPVDARAAIKQAVTLINETIQKGGMIRFCVERDGVSHRMKKGDTIKAKIITEEDL